jgi:uncharacterized membrane-anchored protein YhcB (DUF1043 family)
MDMIVWLAIAGLIMIGFVRLRFTKHKTKVHLDKATKIQEELQRLRDKRNE